jgi:proteasome lid subunit RPN8/RPN11
VTTLATAALTAIRTHGTAAYPQECCGALIGSEDAVHDVREAWPIENVAASEDYRRAEARAAECGSALLGFYHSHPDAPARPSGEDLAQAWPNLDYIIISVRHGRPADISCWRLRDDRSGFDREDMTWPIGS